MAIFNSKLFVYQRVDGIEGVDGCQVESFTAQVLPKVQEAHSSQGRCELTQSLA
jgi:hypothetical protein